MQERTQTQRILLVDDDRTATELLVDLLEPYGILVEPAFSVDEAAAKIKKLNYQAVVTDLKMPGKDGINLLDSCRMHYPDIPVVLLTGHATIPSAVEALKKGAFDYIAKPVEIEELVLVIHKAISHERLKAQNTFLKEELERREDLMYETRSPELEKIYATVQNLKDFNSTVLLYGESGTGKEVLARLIHRSSPRSAGSFVPINCGAIPESLIESELFGYDRGAFTDAKSNTKGRLQVADGGTLFLDEINELPPKAQVSLLRFIQERVVVPLGSSRMIHVDVRIIAATNKDLPALVEEGRFREDLFYRINVIPIEVPPLRRRRNDIIPLAQWYIQKFSREHGHPVRWLSAGAEKTLKNYSWPGNIRELRNCIERASISCSGETIEEEDLFLTTRDTAPRNPFETGFNKLGVVPIRDLETEYISWVLEKMEGNRSRAARELGISVRGLRYRLKNETHP